MRILAITSRYPRPGHDTDAPYNREQLRALADLHAVRVVAPVEWPRALRDAAKGLRVPAHRDAEVGSPVYHPVYFYPSKVAQHLYGAFYYHSIKRLVRRIIGEYQPHAILATWAHPDGWAAVRLAREAELPVFIKVIGSDVLVNARAHVRRRQRIAEALQQADGVIAVGQNLAGGVIALGAEPARVHVVPEGIDTSRFTPGPRDEARGRLGLEQDGKVVLFVGSLLASKGCEVLVDACAALRDRGVAFRCYLVGCGRDERRVRSRIARSRLETVVTLAGECALHRLPDWYRAADLVVLPSYSEGIPNVLREAMMCGCPYVATRVGGIPEITDQSVGRLVEPGDVPALAGAIERMLSTGLMVDPARACESNITWAESARRLADVLCGRRRSTAHREDAATVRYTLCGGGE